MNYTIIGHKEATEKYMGCQEYETVPGEFEAFFFRDDREGFIKAWANASYEKHYGDKYDDLIIMIDGIPDNEMNDAEYAALEILETEMQEHEKIIKAEHDEMAALRREAAANAAVEKARLLAKLERARDLQQFEALQRKLNLK